MWYTWSKPRIFRAVQTDLVPVRPRPRTRHFMGTVRVHFVLSILVGEGDSSMLFFFFLGGFFLNELILDFDLVYIYSGRKGGFMLHLSPTFIYLELSTYIDILIQTTPIFPILAFHAVL